MQIQVRKLTLTIYYIAYAFAQLGDITKSKHFMSLQKEFLGEYGQPDSDEQLKLQMANQIVRSYDEQLQQIGVPPEESLSQESKYASMGIEVRNEEKEHSLTGQTDLNEDQINIETAKACFEDFDYQKGLDICLELLRRDYDDTEAHSLILDTFHALGFRNELINNLKAQLR